MWPIGVAVAQPSWFDNKQPARAGHGGERNPFDEQPPKIKLDSKKPGIFTSRVRISRRRKKQRIASGFATVRSLCVKSVEPWRKEAGQN